MVILNLLDERTINVTRILIIFMNSNEGKTYIHVVISKPLHIVNKQAMRHKHTLT